MSSGEGGDFSFEERHESKEIGDGTLSEFRSNPRAQSSACRSSARVILNRVAEIETKEQGVSS